MAAILLTQRLMRSVDDTRIGDDFLTLAYQVIDDERDWRRFSARRRTQED
jgi:hypothetical protein